MRRISAILAALALLVCAGCGPAGEVTPTPAETEPAAAQTPTPGQAGVTVQINGAAIHTAAGWSAESAACAEHLDWDGKISLLSADGSALSAKDIRMEMVPITPAGQELLTARTAVDTAAEGDGLTAAHAPCGGLWDLPRRLNEPVLMGYHITAELGGERQEYYFAVKSDFPTLESDSLARRLQAALESDQLLRSLHAQGDTDGDGRAETITAAVTTEHIPFLAVDGEVVLSMARNDPSFYECADLLALDLDGNGQDEIVILFNNPGAFTMQCALCSNGTWKECFLPELEFSLALEDGFTARLSCPDQTEQILTAAKGGPFYEVLSPLFDQTGAPYRREVPVICRLDTPDYLLLANGIEIHAALDLEAEGIFEPMGRRTVFSVPVVISMENETLTAKCGRAVPAK